MTDRDSLQAGLDALATMEAAAVTLLGVARQRGQDGELDVGDDAVVILRAAQCQDEQHYHALVAAGGLPVTNASPSRRGWSPIAPSSWSVSWS